MSGKEALKGRQNVQLVCGQHIKNSVVPSGLFVLLRNYRGLAPPSVVFRTFGAFPRALIINVNSTKNNYWKLMGNQPLPNPLLKGRETASPQPSPVGEGEVSPFRGRFRGGSKLYINSKL